jgi:addiction module HigA family antidote
MGKKLPFVTPGEILSEEFLKPLELTEYRLAQEIGVPPRRINEIVHGKRAISTDTAYRLAQYFGTTPQFWINAQAVHDLEVLAREGRLPSVPRCRLLTAA